MNVSQVADYIWEIIGHSLENLLLTVPVSMPILLLDSVTQDQMVSILLQPVVNSPVYDLQY